MSIGFDQETEQKAGRLKAPKRREHASLFTIRRFAREKG